MAFEDDYDPRLMREFMNQMQESGKITEELAKEIEKSNTSFAKLRKEGLQKATDSFKAIGGSSKDLASGLIQGKRGFDALNPAIDIAASAIAGLFSIIPGVETATRLVAEGSKLMLSQIQSQVDAFQQVGEVGGLTADGMSGFQRQLFKSGLTLESYTKAIQNSSRSLARFRGLTGDGAEDFSKIVGSLTQSTDLGLRRIGLSADQMGESTEAFLSRQTRLGLSQGLTNAQLAQSTTGYIKELDILSKVTGQSRKAIQAQQDAALSETRFRASIEGMRGTVDESAINSILNFQSSISDMDSTLGAGVRDLASGFTATEAARRAEFVTGGRASKIMAQLQSGQINELQAREQIQQALKDNREQLVFAGRALGDNASIIGNTAGLFDIINAEMGKNGEFIRKANKTQEGQIKGSDGLTNSAVAAQQSIEKMQIEMQKLFFRAMPEAAKITAKFSSTMVEGIDKINDLISGKENLSKNDVDPKKSIYNYSGSTGNTAADILNSLSENNAAKSSYPEATKNLLAAGVTPHSDIVKVAMVEGVHGAKKVAGAKDNDLVSSVLGVEAVMKYGATTIGELKNKIAEVDIPTSGPKQTYSSMTASLDPALSVPETTEIENKKQSRVMDEQVGLLKEQVSKMDQMIAVLTQNYSTSRKILSSSYS